MGGSSGGVRAFALKRALSFVVLGVVTTYALGWYAAALPQRAGLRSDHSWYSDTHGVWTVNGRVGAVSAEYTVLPVLAQEGQDPQEVLLELSTTFGELSTERRMPGWVGLPGSEEAGAQAGLLTRAYGWPMHALRVVDSTVPGKREGVRNGLEMPAWIPGVGGVSVPVVPMWGGFVVNSLLAAVAWGVVYAPVMLVRAGRGRAGSGRAGGGTPAGGPDGAGAPGHG